MLWVRVRGEGMFFKGAGVAFLFGGFSLNVLRVGFLDRFWGGSFIRVSGFFIMEMLFLIWGM